MAYFYCRVGRTLIAYIGEVLSASMDREKPVTTGIRGAMLLGCWNPSWKTQVLLYEERCSFGRGGFTTRCAMTWVY
jgi:hypothetical protein